MKVLVCGLSPLPFENAEKNFGPGVRTWQFAKPLRLADHDVHVYTRQIPLIYPSGTPRTYSFEKDEIPVTSVDWKLADDGDILRGIYDDLEPDAVVGATIYGSYDACTLNPEVPVWVDQFGLVMAEAQAKAFMARDNRHLRRFWKMLRTVMLRGDMFSSVSDLQRYAMIGELGTLGRLTAQTLGYDFVQTIPCGLDGSPIEPRKSSLRGSKIPEDAFVVLWSGGYNVWTDVDTLFTGLDSAMAENQHIYFVSTGGQIDGHDEVTYQHFQSLIAASRHRDRYVLLGWRPKDEITDYYFEANVGINADRDIYEGLFGSRNRILDWMRAALPALASDLPEIAKVIEREGIGFTYPLSEPEALCTKLLELAADPERVRLAGKKANEYGLSNLSFEVTAAPLVEWVSEPKHAPDFQSERALASLTDLDSAQASVPVALTRRLYDTLKPMLDRSGVTRLRLRLKGLRQSRSARRR